MNAVNLNKIQKNVLSVIREHPEAANNDSTLIALYWRKFCDWSDSRTLEENIEKSTRPETITRRRRELFNMGLISYTEDVYKTREEAYANEKQYAAVSWLKDSEECAA